MGVFGLWRLSGAVDGSKVELGLARRGVGGGENRLGEELEFVWMPERRRVSVTFLLVDASGCGMARTRTRSGLERTKGGRDESDGDEDGDEDSDISVFFFSWFLGDRF